MNIKTEAYPIYKNRIPASGQHILAYQANDQIVLYQAYKPSIAEAAVANQQLGGGGFKYERMSWVKPNFLWMMFRSGWAEKVNQERILAIWVNKADWNLILNQAVFSSFNADIYDNHDAWKDQLLKSEVRLQWDPDHDPYGEKVTRRAVQIGMKGDILRQFGQEMIRSIEDITPFVHQQKQQLDEGGEDALLIPKETIYTPENKALNIGLSPI